MHIEDIPKSDFVQYKSILGALDFIFGLIVSGAKFGPIYFEPQMRMLRDLKEIGWSTIDHSNNLQFRQLQDAADFQHRCFRRIMTRKESYERRLRVLDVQKVGPPRPHYVRSKDYKGLYLVLEPQNVKNVFLEVASFDRSDSYRSEVAINLYALEGLENFAIRLMASEFLQYAFARDGDWYNSFLYEHSDYFDSKFLECSARFGVRDHTETSINVAVSGEAERNEFQDLGYELGSVAIEVRSKMIMA